MCNGTKEQKYWIGSINVCQLCNGNFDNDVMYDKSIRGTWGNICCWCFLETDKLLGVGYGQKYELNRKDGKWYLVEGGQ